MPNPENLLKNEDLEIYEKYMHQNKSDIGRRIILDAIYNMRIEQPVINCCKRINLSTFPKYNEETIAQLLGKGGQHKQLFKNITKVDLELDKNNKNAVVVSKYNTIAVEKASELIKKLLNLDSWNVEKMPKLYEEVCDEWDKRCTVEGGRILREFLKYETFTEELAKHVGNLQHIYSFSQNILEHSMEVAQLSANIAFQLDLDPLMAKRAGFFHDIGKAVANYEDHIDKGLKIGNDANLDDYILNAIESHHGRVKPNNPYSMIVACADKLSASREGARPRQIELVNNRMQMIEKEICKLEWVNKCVVKNAGNIVQVFSSLKEFPVDRLPQMKEEVREKLNKIKGEYTYNFQIELQIMYNEIFFLEDKK